MKFLVILLALSVNHYWDRDRVLPVDAWYRDFAIGLRQRLTERGGGSHWYFGMAALVPALLLLLLLSLVDGVLLGLVSVCVHVLLLLCLFDPQNLRAWLAGYVQRWRAGDFEAAFLCLQQRWPGLRLDSGDDLEAVHGQCCRYVLMSSFERLFAVLFWYLVTGPVGAVVYYSLVQLRALALAEGDWDTQGWPSRLLFLLEWVPARLLGLTFSLAGDFEAGFQCLRSCCFDTTRSATSVVLSCAKAATGNASKTLFIHDSAAADATVIIDMDAGSDAPSAAAMEAQLLSLLSLTERSQIIWVAALAVFVVAGIGT